MARIQSELSLDATFRPRRERPFVSILVLSCLVACTFLRGDGAGQLYYLEAAVIFVGMVFAMSLATLANLTSDEPGAGGRFAFALGALFASRDALAARRLVGRVRIREAVVDPRTGGDVGAYFHAEPSPRERPWSSLLRVIPRLYAYFNLPGDALRVGAGEIDVVLGDGRVARVVTDAVELLDRRRFALLESRHVVVREGDVVEVRGIAAWNEEEGAYLFEGARGSRVTLTLRERPRAA